MRPSLTRVGKGFCAYRTFSGGYTSTPKFCITPTLTNNTTNAQYDSYAVFRIRPYLLELSVIGPSNDANEGYASIEVGEGSYTSLSAGPLSRCLYNTTTSCGVFSLTDSSTRLTDPSWADPTILTGGLWTYTPREKFLFPTRVPSRKEFPLDFVSTLNAYASYQFYNPDYEEVIEGILAISFPDGLSSSLTLHVNLYFDAL